MKPCGNPYSSGYCSDHTKLTARQVLESLTPELVGHIPPPYMSGISASVGIASGKPCQTLKEIEDVKAAGLTAIFVAKDTSAEDVQAINLADGIITMVGGFTSHAAVVARAFNTPCIVGVAENQELLVNQYYEDLSETGQVTIDGRTGKVYEGELEVDTPDDSEVLRLASLFGFQESRDAEILNVANMDPDEALALVKFHIKHSSKKLVLTCSVRTPKEIQAIWGANIVPEELETLVRKLGEIYDPTDPKFELDTNYELEKFTGSPFDFIVRDLESPTDFLRASSLRMNDQTLCDAFGSLEAANVFITGAEIQNIRIAKEYRKPNQPMKSLINLLRDNYRT